VGDIVLGSALGYDRPRDIRKLFPRLMPHLEKFGLTPSRTASWLSGKGGKRETTEYLLNLGQIKTDYPLRLASG
jgi:hypothetical protein